MAIGADSWRRPLASEELLAMAVQTCRMFGKLRDIGKSRIAFSNFLPIRRWELMTRITGELLIRDMSGMRKFRVIRARILLRLPWRRTSRAGTCLSFNCRERHHHRQH